MQYTIREYFENLLAVEYFGKDFNRTITEYGRYIGGQQLIDAAWGILSPVELKEFERRYEAFIRPHIVEKHTKPVIIHLESKRIRKLTLPIYPLNNIDYKIHSCVWTVEHDCENYGTKSTHGTNLTSRLFKNCLFIKSPQIKKSITVLMCNIYRVLINVFNIYSTFTDYENLSLHIIFMGDDYYQSVITNPNIIIPTLIREDYVKLWDMYNDNQ